MLPDDDKDDLEKVKSTRKKTAPKPRPRVIAAKARERDVTLRSRWPGRLIVLKDTVPSGTRYEFPRPGSTLEVRAEDVPELLSRRRKPAGCCGAGKVEQLYFEVV